MVLLHCRYCSDVFALRALPRTCSCMLSGGFCRQGVSTVWGESTPLVIEDADLERAVELENSGESSRLSVLVPPPDSPRIFREDAPHSGWNIPF